MMTPDKKAILAVSFGTSHADTRAAAISAIEQRIRSAHPDIPLYSAWTSQMIIRKLARTTGEHICTVSEALEQMKRDGVTDVRIQPTHILNGIENDRMTADALAFQKDFSSMAFGAPLLSSTEDLQSVIRIIAGEFSFLSDDEALILMGHGSDHFSNTVYAALDYMLKDLSYSHIHVGTVEAYPSLQEVLEHLKESQIHSVHLLPLMIVAGDHAKNDMAGAGPDSWKMQCQNAGYQVTCHLKGLGEFPQIQDLFLSHLEKIL
nr:sirohydrochlorin cobaltochelatase [uncultured Merdimonas sp.]